MNPTRLFPLLLLGCGEPEKDPPSVTDADADTDADTDVDTDPAEDADGDGSPTDLDCDDADETVFPGAPDVCGDDRVTDCDRTSDDGLVTVDGSATFTDLAAALSAGGATVLVCPGTYVGAFASPAPVDLVSHGGSEATILDGGGAGTTLSLAGGSTVTGFTVTGGLVDGFGGGITQTSGPTLLITECLVTGNRARFGGGIAAASGTLTVTDSTVSQNTAGVGGGGLWVPDAVVDLTGSTVEGNEAGYGGGIYIDGGSISGGVVSGNRSTQDVATLGDPNGGGGISTHGEVTLTAVEIRGNDGVLGGGMGASEGSLGLVGVLVEANNAVYGGGLNGRGVEVVLDEASELTANNADNGGGAWLELANLAGGSVTGNTGLNLGGGFFVNSGRIEGVDITGNNAVNGGGVYLVAVGALTGGRLGTNTATIGGGLFGAGDCEIDANGVEFTDNAAVAGAGMYVIGCPSVVLEACTVARNVASDVGGGAMLFLDTRLSSVGTDWGTGADDNLPGDVLAGVEYTGYGAGATFTCGEAGCDPSP